MAKRHNLEKTVIDKLHQSTRELIETAKKQDSKLSNVLISQDRNNLDTLVRLIAFPEINEIFTTAYLINSE